MHVWVKLMACLQKSPSIVGTPSGDHRGGLALVLHLHTNQQPYAIVDTWNNT